MNLSPTEKRHLAFQIVSYSLEIEPSNIQSQGYSRIFKQMIEETSSEFH